MPKSLMKKEDMTIQEMEAKSQAWIDEDNAARKLDAPFSKEEIEKMDEQHAQDEMDRKMNEGYNRSRKSKGGSMLVPPEREKHMAGALIKAGARASKKLLDEAKKHVNDLKTKPSKGQGDVSAATKGQRATRDSIRKTAAGTAIVLEGPAALEKVYDALNETEQERFRAEFSSASTEGLDAFDFTNDEGKTYSVKVAIAAGDGSDTVYEKKMSGGMMKYNEGGNVEEKEKLKNILQAGEDGADKAIVEIMKYIPGSEGPPKGLVDLLEPVLRKAGEMYRENKKIKKAEGGSMLVPPEMEEDMPVDTYDNIPEDEMAAAEASQLPDDEMEDGYLEFVLNESLETDDQEYLMSVLETDERLSSIFDKVMDVAGEFSGEGEVDGPGTGVSDSIPARLSDGEFVFTKKATDQMGADQLQTMMDEAEKAYDGGLMKKAFGGLTLDPMQDEKMMYGGEQMKSTQDDLRKQMLSANRMPSVQR